MDIDALEQIKKVLIALVNDDNDEVMLDAPVLVIPPNQVDDFIDRAKRWFGASRIEAKQTVKMPETIGNNSFLNTEHASYVDFIRYCATHPLEAFATCIYQYLELQINRLEKVQQPIIHTYLEKRQHGNDLMPENDNQDAPSSCKRPKP